MTSYTIDAYIMILNIVKNTIIIRIYALKRKLISYNLTFVDISISLYIFGKLRLDGVTTEKGSSS